MADVLSGTLTPEEIAQYTLIIDGIFNNSDLETISRKKVRQALERAIGGKDLSEQKSAIKVLIEQRFDAVSAARAAPEAMPTPPHKREDEDMKNGLHNGGNHMDEDADADADADADEDASAGEIQVSTALTKKRTSSMVEDEDARLARELQAQENQLARGRQTRGGNNTPRSKPKTKKKSSAKVKNGDDSDVDTEDSGPAKKRKAGGGFQKEFNLSFPLQEVVGAERLSRPQVVKKLWEHIKANDLQDPSDKRQIRCDEKLQAVFKQNTVNMFSMNKLLGNQLYPLDE